MGMAGVNPVIEVEGSGVKMENGGRKQKDAEALVWLESGTLEL